MSSRAGLALLLLLTLGVVSASGQENVRPPADSLDVRADSDSRFGVSFILATLGSAAGLFIGAAVGVGVADESDGDYAELGRAFLGAAVGARNRGVWPYLGGAVGCVAASLVFFNVNGAEGLLYFPAQGFAAALFAQIGR